MRILQTGNSTTMENWSLSETGFGFYDNALGKGRSSYFESPDDLFTLESSEGGPCEIESGLPYDEYGYKSCVFKYNGGDMPRFCVDGDAQGFTVGLRTRIMLGDEEGPQLFDSANPNNFAFLNRPFKLDRPDDDTYFFDRQSGGRAARFRVNCGVPVKQRCEAAGFVLTEGQAAQF
mmetsp:Transcript_5918/g.10743  ORF Transcript_5918/g.10743 Transcript_5918/m.10743 type:complete len:176 (-) Transcript_5918:407-934(-)